MTHPFVHRQPTYPTRRPEVIRAAIDQLERGDWARLEGCPELEADLTAWHGPDPAGRPPTCWFVASGTAALEALLLGHGIGPGDKVITTPLTWAATTAAILAVGAVPVFCDVDPLTGLMDPATVGPLIDRAVRAILTVHLYGHPVACRELRELADIKGILLLEDASQAHGARYAGRRVGDWGHGAAFSCMGLKPLAGTEGGYALFRDPEAAESAYLYGKHPRGLGPDQVERAGDLLDALQLGWRPCAVSGALIRTALPHLEAENTARRANAAVLREGLAGQDGVILPSELPQAEGVYHLLSLVLATEVHRADYLDRLRRAGLEPFVYIPTPIHRLRRMQAFDYEGPRVFWHEQLRRARMDYRDTCCPAAEDRCLQSFELSFNWTTEDPAAMRGLARVLVDCLAG